MNSIKQRYLIKAPLEKVWDALINPKTIEKWGGGPCKMSYKENFEFSLWGGEIFGKNIKVVSKKNLKQEWYGGKWDKPSILTFNLNEQNGVTTVTLNQTGVPGNELKDIEQGWKDYYMIPLKEFVEQS